ncbi:hypothetical protein ABZ738_30470 [Micromonospora sp. NPDC047793]|uniref:hypothetical protein n=1 Tax=Micromonospora sp. NPDC047793 TaxID=3154342 RepID=UPI00340B2838
MTTSIPLRGGATLAALALMLAGCGGDQTDSPIPVAATPVATSAAPVAGPTSPSPTPAPSTSPTGDPYAPLTMGTSTTVADGAATATVYSYRHNVATTAPRPDEQPGFVWAAADVKVYAGKDVADGISVSNLPWTLVYADDTQYDASSIGYQQFPKPKYPWGEKLLAPGRCVRGWITFPVPGKPRSVAVEYAPDDVLVAPRWSVK